MDRSEQLANELLRLREQQATAIAALLEAAKRWDESYPDGSIGVLRGIQKALAALDTGEKSL